VLKTCLPIRVLLTVAEILTCMISDVKTVLWSTTTVPPPVKRLMTCSCCF
jgi:hypothetical protein